MSITQELERLAALYEQGKLSTDEFRRAKEAVIGGNPAPVNGSNGFGAWIQSLHRSRRDVWLGGVCGGLAVSTDTPSWLWRLVFTLLLLCAGTGVVFYLLMWIFLPAEEVVPVRTVSP